MLTPEQEKMLKELNTGIGLVLDGITNLPRNEHAHLLDQVDTLLETSRQKLAEYGSKSRHPAGTFR